MKVRGEAMQAASEMADSGMITVFVGADQKLNFGCEVAREWCRRHHDIEEPVCQVFTLLKLFFSSVHMYFKTGGKSFILRSKSCWWPRACSKVP